MLIRKGAMASKVATKTSPEHVKLIFMQKLNARANNCTARVARAKFNVEACNYSARPPRAICFCMACTCFCRACSDNKFTASFLEVEGCISKNTLLYFTGSVYSPYQSDSPRGRPFEHLWQSKNSRKGNGQLFALWIGPL